MPVGKNSNQVGTVVTKEIYDKIAKISDKERRSMSQTTAILIEYGLEYIKKKQEYSYLFIDDEK